MVNFASNTKNGNCIVIVRNKFFFIFLFIFAQLTLSSVAQAEENATDKGWFSTFTDNVSQTGMRQSTMISTCRPSRHARFAYDKEKTDKYNERPWGQVLVSRAGTKRATGMAFI